MPKRKLTVIKVWDVAIARAIRRLRGSKRVVLQCLLAAISLATIALPEPARADTPMTGVSTAIYPFTAVTTRSFTFPSSATACGSGSSATGEYTQNGHLAIVILHFNTAGAVTVTPPGTGTWNLKTTITGTGMQVRVYYKVWNSSQDSATQTWTWNTAQTGTIQGYTVRDFNATFDVLSSTTAYAGWGYQYAPGATLTATGHLYSAVFNAVAVGYGGSTNTSGLYATMTQASGAARNYMKCGNPVNGSYGPWGMVPSANSAAGVTAAIGLTVRVCPMATYPCGSAYSPSTNLATTNGTAASYAADGSPRTITMSLSNTGTDVPGGARWQAALPAQFTNVSWTCAVTGTGSCGTASGSGNSVNLTNVSLSSGSSATLTWTASPSTAGAQLMATSSVSVPSAWSDSAAANNSATVVTTLTPVGSTDLSAANNLGGAYVTGEPTTVTMTLSNTGTSFASGGGLSASLNAAFGSTTWTCDVSVGTGSCGTASGSGNSVSLANIGLNTGSTMRITFTTTPTTAGAGSATITGSVPAGWSDTNAGNNTAARSTKLALPVADLVLANVRATPMPVKYLPLNVAMYTPLRYEYTLTNNGPNTATGASFAFTAPSNTQVSYWECINTSGTADCDTTDSTQGAHRSATVAGPACGTPGTITTSAFTANNLMLANGATLRFVVHAYVCATNTAQAVTATANAGASSTDSNAANNTWTGSITSSADGGSAISFINERVAFSNGNSVTVSAWQGFGQSGDKLYAFVMLRNGTAGEVFNTPAGWTKLGTSIRRGSNRLAVFYRNYDPTVNAWTFTTSQSGAIGATVSVYRGVGSAAPIAPDPAGRDSNCAADTSSSGEYRSSAFASWTSPCFIYNPWNFTWEGIRTMPLNALATGGKVISFYSDASAVSGFDLRDGSGLVYRRGTTNGDATSSNSLSYMFGDLDVVVTGATESQDLRNNYDQIPVIEPIGIQIMLCSGASGCGTQASAPAADIAVRWVSIQDGVGSDPTYRIDRNVAKQARFRIWNNGGGITDGSYTFGYPASGFTFTGFACTAFGGASCGTCSGNTMTCAGMTLPQDGGSTSDGETSYVDITFNVTASNWNTAPSAFTVQLTGDGTVAAAGNNNYASINLGTRGLGNFVVTPTTATALSCEPLSVTVAAKDFQGNPFVPEAGWQTEVKLYNTALSTAAAHGDWKAITSQTPAGIMLATLTDSVADDGVAIITWNGTAHTVTLSLRHYYDETVRVRARQISAPTQSGTGACLPETASTALGGCGYSDVAGYDFNHFGLRAVDGSGNSITLANGTAGTATPITLANGKSTFFLQAVQSSACTGGLTGACTGACSPSGDYSGNRTMQVRVGCTNPTTCAGGILRFSQDGAVTWPAGLGAAADGNWRDVTLAFTAAELPAAAKVSLAYKDVGQINVQVRDKTQPAISVTTNTFVVRPSALAFTAVNGNGAFAWPADATGAKLTDVDTNFTVQVTAKDSDGSVTPNFGREAVPQTPVIAHALAAPAGGTLGSLSTPSWGTFDAGSGTLVTRYGEVGLITLTATLSDYLAGGTGSIAATSGNIGRFVPTRLAVTSASLTNRHQSPIAGIGGAAFNYMGEKLRVDFTVQAQNAAGGVLRNYQTGATGATNWAKLGEGIGAFNVALRDTEGGTTLSSVAGFIASQSLAFEPVASGFTNGAASYKLEVQTNLPGAPLAPFESVKVGIAPNDGDATLAAGALNFSSSGGANDRVQLGANTKFRYGRLMVAPFSHTPPAADGAIRLVARYYVPALGGATDWVKVNTLDSQTRLPKTAIAMANWAGALGACETYVYTDQTGGPPNTGLTDVTLNAGVGTFRLRRPGVTNRGRLTLSLHLAQAAPGGQTTCVVPGNEGSQVAAAGWPANTVLTPMNALGATGPVIVQDFFFESLPLEKKRKLFARENF